MGSGAVPRLVADDVRRLVEVAASGKAVALTNNRYSSDVCAIGQAECWPTCRRCPATTRCRAGWKSGPAWRWSSCPLMSGSALDLDYAARCGAFGARRRDAPAWARSVARTRAARGPASRRAANARCATRTVSCSSSAAAARHTLAWLEQNVRCRVRFLAEERGMRASSPLAIGGPQPSTKHRHGRLAPRSGLLLDARGPQALRRPRQRTRRRRDRRQSRVLLAHRLWRR